MIIELTPLQMGFASLILAGILAFVYVRIASKLGWIDVPNNRSSHSRNTIRGIGVVPIVVLFLLSVLTLNTTNLYFLLSLMVGTVTGFLDDLFNLKVRLRLVLYSVSVMLLIFSAGLVIHPLLTIVVFVLVLGVINAYNFIDGINGLTLAYTLGLLSTVLLILWKYDYDFSAISLITIISIVIVLLLFNFRTTAIAFLGDSGSIFFGLVTSYYILVLNTFAFKPLSILLLAVYGVDSVATIILRILRKENIFEAHRLHLYQKLANEKKIPHLKVTALYLSVQLLINLIVVLCYDLSTNMQIILGSIVILVMAFFYTFLRWSFIKDFKSTT
jgi:UDP-GlcNAc:undecaprenyl-phosphate/decaprenyl-phosphate GlcNAc-1-phosphate transferase